MDIYKELTSGHGYAVVPVENMEMFTKLRDSFVERINISNGSEKNIDSVRKAMAKMTKAEINRSMIDILKFTNLSEIIINSFPKLIELLCGKELFIQRRATVITNVPGEGQAKQWPHYELMSGISPFTYIIWAPLHDLEAMSGAYYIDRKESLKFMKKEQAAGLVNGPTVLNLMQNQKPTSLKFGQAIIFNPFIIHGNVTFNSKFARIASGVRFQSCNKPLLQKNSEYLKYYRLT